MVSLKTGAGVELALAPLFSGAHGSRAFEFVDGGSTLQVTGDVPGPLDIFERPEAAKTVRIVLNKEVKWLGGIWAPLLPNVTAIDFETVPRDPSPRTFVGLRLSKLASGGGNQWNHHYLSHNCCAFDGAPWAAVFGMGESIESALMGRTPSTITQACIFVQADRQEWPQLRTWNEFAFAFAGSRSFDFYPGVQKIEAYAFAFSDLEVVAGPDCVTSIGLGCFRDC
jgi:hypothetical protein